MENEDIFRQYFQKDFCDLAKDRIVNVKMTMSMVLASHYKTKSESSPYINNSDI